jgi:hypothetical protein
MSTFDRDLLLARNSRTLRGAAPSWLCAQDGQHSRRATGRWTRAAAMLHRLRPIARDVESAELKWKAGRNLGSVLDWFGRMADLQSSFRRNPGTLVPADWAIALRSITYCAHAPRCCPSPAAICTTLFARFTEGVGSRFRTKRLPYGLSLPENDSRPRPQASFTHKQSSSFVPICHSCRLRLAPRRILRWPPK